MKIIKIRLFKLSEPRRRAGWRLPKLAGRLITLWSSIRCPNAPARRGCARGLWRAMPRSSGALTRVMEYGGAGMPLPIQAAAAALWRDDRHVEGIRAIYRANFAAAAEIIGDRWNPLRRRAVSSLWLNVGNGEAATHAPCGATRG